MSKAKATEMTVMNPIATIVSSENHMNQLRLNSNQQGIGLIAAMVGAGVFGVMIILVALSLYPDSGSVSQVNAEPSVEYGRQLIRETSSTMGPNHEDPAMRFSGTNLDCASCHLDTGTEPGTLSLLLADTKYPRFSGRAANSGE